MLWQLFIVLVATAAASTDDSEEDVINCMSLVSHECNPEEEPRDGFPRNEEELEEFCNITLRYFECRDRVLSNCEGEDSDNAGFLADVAANVRRVCNDDAVLKTAIAENLPCFQDNFFHIQICASAVNMDREEFRDSFSKFMNETGLADVEEDDSQPRKCLDALFVSGCAAATAAELCGNMARDIVINILQGMDRIFEVCPSSLKERLPEIAEVMQMAAEKAKSVEKTLKKKK